MRYPICYVCAIRRKIIGMLVQRWEIPSSICSNSAAQHEMAPLPKTSRSGSRLAHQLRCRRKRCKSTRTRTSTPACRTRCEQGFPPVDVTRHGVYHADTTRMGYRFAYEDDSVGEFIVACTIPAFEPSFVCGFVFHFLASPAFLTADEHHV